MKDFLLKAKAVMTGHAVADALGVPVEFNMRERLDDNPVTDMTGYGTHNVPKGAWSDDTSMSLCVLESLSKGKIDYDDTMINFGRWYYNGEFTPTDKMFDVGNTCSEAIFRYHSQKMPFNECGLSDGYSNGNGSLMRIHPTTLFLIHKNVKKASLEHINIIGDTSALTHAHPRSRLACVIYSFILWELLEKPCKKSVAKGLRTAEKLVSRYSGELKEYGELNTFRRLFDGVEKLERQDIRSGGYVVHTLEAAIWCLLTTESYRECVLKAVNLGDDTDTTAAVAGGLAGALYGYDAIPEEWRNALIRREYIEGLCDKAFK